MLGMETINKEKLISRLQQDGYADYKGKNETINRLLNLTGKPKEMLIKWINTGEIENFEPIEGIDVTYLRKNLKMKNAAIVLAYAMLLVDPTLNSLYLKGLAFKFTKF